MKKYSIALALFNLQMLFAGMPPNPTGKDGGGGTTPGTPVTPIDSNLWILLAVAVIMIGFYAYRQASSKIN